MENAPKWRDENGGPKAEAESSSAPGSKTTEGSGKPSESPKQDYIHVRARRGQATDSHSLAERARREKIGERMKLLQDLVPGCNKAIGKALVLDEIIDFIQSLQRQVEFLSVKLEAVNSSPPIEAFPSKERKHWKRATSFNATGMMLSSQAAREYLQGSHPGGSACRSEAASRGQLDPGAGSSFWEKENLPLLVSAVLD